MNEEEIRSSAAARALGALDSRDAQDVRKAAALDAALTHSPELRDEADAFAETAAQLGLAATPVEPPAGLRARLLADIARTPQLPASGRDPGAAVSAAAPGSEFRPESPAEARARGRWYRNPGLVLGGAAAALALFAGGVALGAVIDDHSPRMEAQADRLAELYAAPDARRTSADVEGGQTATLVWSEELDRSVVVFDALAALPSGSVYEAWYINSAGNATPAGTFSADPGEPVYHLLDGSLGRGGTVGVTVEPTGGSDAPTTKPIVLLSRT